MAKLSQFPRRATVRTGNPKRNGRARVVKGKKKGKLVVIIFIRTVLVIVCNLACHLLLNYQRLPLKHHSCSDGLNMGPTIEGSRPYSAVPLRVIFFVNLRKFGENLQGFSGRRCTQSATPCDRYKKRPCLCESGPSVPFFHSSTAGVSQGKAKTTSTSKRQLGSKCGSDHIPPFVLRSSHM